MKWIAVTIVALMATLGYIAWRNSTQPAAQESGATQSMPPEGGAAMAEEPADPGLEWDAPGGWSVESAGTMRLATYTIPGQGGAAPAQCAVHYFGPGQGGAPDANIDRWLGEFENPRDPERKTQTVHGIRVWRARVRGTYQSHGGSLDQEPGAAARDQQLLGAIVEGPKGPVFFKLTGPSATVDRAAPDFDRMIGSVRAK
jgi:hypothetical protein